MDRLPGFRDFYPEPLPQPGLWSADARQYVFRMWRETARRYGFREYDGPPLEPLELFTVKSGEEIIGQLYNFKDKGDRAISLRPEMTPTLARMVAAHERSYRKPLKWFAIPQLFRYERQQKGRLREHFQLNADIVGEKAPSADAELISLLIDVLRALGLTEKDFVIRLSSREAWREFYAAHHGGSAGEFEFYQIIDKLERDAPEVSTEKLRKFGLSLGDINAFIEAGKPTKELGAIMGDLAARGFADYVNIDYRVIRGLAYYTGPVFEAFARNSELRAIAGGGRYDNLIGLLSGGKVNLPALGFGMGDVVLLELLKEKALLPAFDAGIDAYFLIDDDSLRGESLRVIQSLRHAGLAVDFPLDSANPDKQFKRAVDVSARHTIKLERSATAALGARIRNLRTREERSVDPASAAEVLRKPGD